MDKQSNHDLDWNIIYKPFGCRNRYEYFTMLSIKYGIPTIEIIYQAEKLGVIKDFTDLVDWVKQQRQLDVIQQEHN